MGLLRSIKTALGIGLLAGGAAAAGALLPTAGGHGGPGLLAADLSALGLPDRGAREAALITAPNPDFYLDGAFYQPDIAEGFSDPVRRRADLERMADAGARTIWLQYLAHGDFSLLDPWPERIDPVRGLLDDAVSVGLKVWMGTREDPRIWGKDEVSARIWKEAGDRALLIAEEASARYGTHPAVVGWYWTPEVVWPEQPGPGRVQRLARISRSHIRRLRSLVPGKPIAVALGPGGRVDEEIPAVGWCQWLQTVQPDVVVVMDGVGTGHVDVTQLDAVYAAAAGCAERIGARLVADIEVFGPGMQPDPVRLIQQMHAAQRRATEVVAFDLPHHLKPGSVGAMLLAGRGPTGSELDVQLIRTPAGDWAEDRPELATLDLVTNGAVQLTAVEIVTRYPHPEALSLSLDEGRELAVVGALERFHGPGRDEVTWRWSGEQRVRAARVTLRRGEGALDVLASRLRGVPRTPAGADPEPDSTVSPEEGEVHGASPATRPPG
jgi:hypothetical protein